MQFYLIMCIIPKINNKIIPNIFAKIPILLLEYLPIIKPIKVNVNAQTLKTNPDNKKSFVIACNPKPVEKLSKLTDKDIKNILIIFKSNVFSSPLNKSTIISIPIIININPSKKLTFIFKIEVIL